MASGLGVSLWVSDHVGNPPVAGIRGFIDLVKAGGSATFGRDSKCDFVLRPADLNNEFSDKSISRIVGEFVVRDNGHDGREVEVWNLSTTNWLIITGDRGFTTNLAPRSRTTLTQFDPVIWLEGQEANYGFTLNNPDADDEVYKRRAEELAAKLGVHDTIRQQTLLATSAESLRGQFAPAHQAILEAMFRDYLSPRPGVFPRPRSVREVREELAGSSVIKASYQGPLTDANVNRALKSAIEVAKKHKVPGMEQSADSLSRRPADQSEWTRHRLAMFLLGAGVISRSD